MTEPNPRKDGMVTEKVWVVVAPWWDDRLVRVSRTHGTRNDAREDALDCGFSNAKVVRATLTYEVPK